MATISPRFDDQGVRIGWQVKIRKRGYPQQVKTFRKKSEAEAWAKKIESEMERGVWRDSSEAEATTLSEAFERYAREVTPTKKNYQPELNKIRHWQAMPVARIALARVGGREIAEAIRRMESEGKSANTVRLYLAVLSHLYKVAKTEWGMTTLVNPVELVRKPRLPQGRDRRLVGDEEQRLLEACDKDENKDIGFIVRFAIETAARRSEICRLRWEDVDLSRRIATLIDTKNGETRHAPLSSVAMEILRSIPRRIDGRVWDVKPDTVTRSFERVCRRAGIEDLRFHDLRHEATSRLFEKGFNPMEVSTITGHKTLQMLKRYTHLRAEDLAKRLG